MGKIPETSNQTATKEEAMNLTGKQITTLAILDNGPISASQIADKMGISHSAAFSRLRGLQLRGLAESRLEAFDIRYWGLTSSGTAKLRKLGYR